MYRRPGHARIAELLGSLDGDYLAQCECWFAGGTAIALQLDEYRRSDDIDFLCASTDGYRRLRERVSERGIEGLARDSRPDAGIKTGPGFGSLPVLRPARVDQYGIRAVLGTADAPIKFEIVREARIDLAAGPDRIAGVPVLRRDDQYAEKLLANADRGLDASTCHRDLIDLCLMVSRWGPIPSSALAKARTAYGVGVDRAVESVAAVLAIRSRLTQCLAALDAAPELVDEITPLLSSARLLGSPG